MPRRNGRAERTNVQHAKGHVAQLDELPAEGRADALKTITAEAHRYAETRPLQKLLISGTITPGRLAVYLAQLRALHALVEDLFDRHPTIAVEIGWSDHLRHSRRLEADINALDANGQVDRQPIASTQDAITAIERAVERTPASLFGFIYVLEGSMNGNRFIARVLRTKSGIADCDLSYFDPYREEQPARWKAFRRALSDATVDPDAERPIRDAATLMFHSIATISDEVMAMAMDDQPVIVG